MTQAKPAVSILIPNFNNGRESSHDGRHDHIGRLLQSLHETLVDDPTPFEVIALDDGSTDDSLATLREWAGRKWPDGRVFLRLIEREHCGVLARTANELSRAAEGRILARLDGDTEMLTPGWVSILTDYFDHGPPGLGVVGPKQLRPDGRIHAFGDWVIHPNGYHHIAAGAERYAVRHAIEVDHVMGCFYCCKRQVYEELGGYDEGILRGQTIDFGLRARVAGYRCFAIPHIEYIHAHGLRQPRTTEADTAAGVRKSLDAFEAKWGFNRIAPDLEVVRERYRGTGLLWHPRWTELARHDAPAPAAVAKEQSDWARYESHGEFRASVDHTVDLIVQVAGQLRVRGPIAQVDCGQGLLTHLLAMRGYETIGVDGRDSFLDVARQAVGERRYGVTPPRFELQRRLGALPLREKSVEMVLLIHVAQSHPNPVGLFNELFRVLRPGGAGLIVAQRRRSLDVHPLEATHPYRLEELMNQLNAAGLEVLADPRRDDPQRDIIVPVRRPGVLTREPVRAGNGQAVMAG